MVCTPWVSEKDLNSACAKAMAACSALPLLLGRVRCLISPSAIRARCSSTAANKCSLWEETSLILRLDLCAHSHLSGYQLLLPNHLQGSKSACVMLPPACSEHHRWLWHPHGLAATGQGPALGTSSRAVPSWKGRLALLGMLWSGEERSAPQPSKTPSCLEAEVSTSVLRAVFVLQKSSFFSEDIIFLNLPPHVLSYFFLTFFSVAAFGRTSAGLPQKFWTPFKTDTCPLKHNIFFLWWNHKFSSFFSLFGKQCWEKKFPTALFVDLKICLLNGKWFFYKTK